MEKNVVILFLSSSNEKILSIDKHMTNKDYESDGWHQTNEAGIYYLHKELQKKGSGIDRLFMLRSKDSNNEVLKEDGLPKFKKSPYEYFVEGLSSHLAAEGDDSWSTMFKGESSIIPYDDSPDKELESAINDTFNLADSIISYAKELEQGTVINVHLDITGGFRHITMMLLAAVRLLEKSSRHVDVRVGRIVYSSFSNPNIKVLDATEVFKSMDFISGIQEFIQFGSPMQLKDYMVDYIKKNENRFDDREKAIIEPTENLLYAMEKFYCVIRICKTRQVNNTVSVLKASYKKWQKNYDILFDNGGCGIIPIKLFHKVQNFLGQEYGKILANGKVSIFDIIRYCLDKYYIQQALTLCTELTLVELYNANLCKMANETQVLKEFQKKYIKQSEKSWRDTLLWQFFINDYLNNKYEKEDRKHKLSLIIDKWLEIQILELSKRYTSAIV